MQRVNMSETHQSDGTPEHRRVGDGVVRVSIVADSAIESLLVVDVLEEIRRRWLLILVAMIGSIAGAIGLGLALTKKYDAEVSFVHIRGNDEMGNLDRIMGQLGALGALAGLSRSSGEELRDEDLALLQSRGFLERFIADRGLLTVLFADDWDERRRTWLVTDPDDVPTMNDAIDKLQERVIKVRNDPATSVITLRVRWRDPVVAADWANDLVRRVNDFVRVRTKSDADKSVAFLNGAAAKTESVEMRNAIFRLVETQLKTAMLTSVREEYAFRIVDRAVARDADDYAVPNFPLLAVVFGLLGSLAAMTVLAWRVAARRRSPESS